jgi:hypothetical protein
LEGDQIFVFEEEDVIHVAEDEEDVYIQLGCWLDELGRRGWKRRGAIGPPLRSCSKPWPQPSPP